MFSKIKTINILGLDVRDVEIEVHMSNGNPGLTIVGLADKSITESRDRIRSAILAMGLGLPPKRITVNLSPSDIYKEGSYYDLPIILGILCVMGILKTEDFLNYYALGEIGLNGDIRKTTGVLVAAMHAAVKKMDIICPFENGKEAAWAGENVDIVAPKNIMELVNHFKLRQTLPRPEMDSVVKSEPIDFAEIKGQKHAKRAMEIAAAGGHNILLVGSQGTGKSMLAKRITTILPKMSAEEILEVNMIQSVCGMLENGKITVNRPFRSPHHSASMPSMIGGGRSPAPGEVTLSHRGVLFLDELPEYQRVMLDCLRQPMEDGKVLVTRVGYKIEYPAKFQLVAAMNPCKCGNYGSVNGCQKPECARQYQSRLSGPFLDRMDIKVEMANQKFSTDWKDKDEEKSIDIQKRVEYARQIQRERYKTLGLYTNAELHGDMINEHCLPKTKEDLSLLEEIYTKLSLSMRGYAKMLKVARTIADLKHKKDVEKNDILEAASYRADKMLV